MNESRTNRFTERDGEKFSEIDNELEIIFTAWNQHDSGLKGWTALSLKDGANKSMGQAVLVGGTVLVANTKVTANTRIFLSHANTSGTLGHLYISARVASTSFTITSSSATDTSTVNWLLIEPK